MIWLLLTGVGFAGLGAVAGSSLGRIHPEAAGEVAVPDQAEPLTHSPLEEPDPGGESPESLAIPGAPTEPKAATAAVAVSTLAPSFTGLEGLGDLPVDDAILRVDELLLEGNYRPARDGYAVLARTAVGLPEARIRLRQGLCEEVLGNLSQAQAEYRRVIELKPGLALCEAAILGQARLWKLARREEMAIATLYRALLEGATQGTDAARSQIPHFLAVLVSGRVGTSAQNPSQLEKIFDDQVMLAPAPGIHPEVILAELRGHETAQRVGTGPSGENIAVVQRFSQDPEEIFLTMSTGRLAALEIVRRVANKSGWSVRLTEEARLRLQEHTLQPACIDLPLALILDSVLEPFELIWHTESDSILISSASQASSEVVSFYRTKVANRTLRYACATAPDHPWAAASFLELGRVAAVNGNLELAGRHISKALDQFPRSEYLAAGWLNLGKLQLRQGQLDRALESFHRATDMLDGQPLEPAGYIYAGRIHLEKDEPREAIPPLTRALVLAERTRFEPMAALMLSSAYLLLEHFQRANDLLMEHRSSFRGDALSDQAAFLSSLIRYRAATDARDRHREGATLVGTLTNIHAGSGFGGHWPYLIGAAYRDTGMTSEEISVLRAGLLGPYAYPLQFRIRQLLLSDAGGEAEPPPQDAAAQSNRWPKGVLAEATTAFRQGRHEQAISLCRELLSSQTAATEDHRAALRLMGQVFQSLGDHKQAVACFAGIIPGQSPALPDLTQEPKGNRR